MEHLGDGMTMNLDEIRLVELELHSQCNRQCKFCPNSYIDRHSTNTFMSDEIFHKVIEELVETNYKGYLSFSRYNEPFKYAHKLRMKVNFIKQCLPDVTLVSNTNGDYDTSDFRGDIEITEMDYDGNKNLYTSKDKRYRVMRLDSINNRGGALTLKQPKRTTPCMEPSYFIGIDYEGSVVPCCNIRHDVKSHKSHILGNVKTRKLVTILNSKKATKFRENVKNMKFPRICKNCTKVEGRYTRDCPGIE